MKTKILPRGAAILAVLSAPGLALAAVSPLDIVQPVAEYKIYVSEKLGQLTADTKVFTDAVKAGDLEKAQSLFAPTRMSYEAVEPIAELFSDLDASIDSRADDHELAEQDPGFIGFHKIEHGLFALKSTDGLAPVADKLMADVTDLEKRISDLALPPEKVVGGAAVLMEEVAATKISGEENRYSGTDLWDFKANFDGSRKIFDLVRPLIEKEDGSFVQKVDTSFETVDMTLAKYRSGDGYENYSQLTEADRKILSANVNTLAEDLSTLRAKLGLD